MERRKKGFILPVYVRTVVGFLFYYSPPVFRLFSQAECRNALEASHPSDHSDTSHSNEVPS